MENPISPVNLPTSPSPATAALISYLCDVNLTMDEIDEKMLKQFPELVKCGWGIGSTRAKVKKYPILARTASEGRMLLWREVGRSKIDGFKVISEAMNAEKIAVDGSATADHEVRMKAADRMLTLMGESVNPAGAKTNITLNGDNQKILITSSDNRPLSFPQRPPEVTDERMES